MLNYRLFAIRMILFSFPLKTGGDFLLTNHLTLLSTFTYYFEFLSLAFILFISLIDLLKRTKFDILLGFLLCCIFYGVIISAFKFNFKYAFLEVLSWIFLLSYCTLIKQKTCEIIQHIRFFCYSIFFIISAKLILSQIYHYIDYGYLSHAIILQRHSLLMIPLVYFSFSLLSRFTLLKLFYVIILSFEILYSYSLALILITGLFFILFFLYKKLSLSFHYFNSIIFSLLFLGLFICTPFIFIIFDDQHRVTQSLELFNRFIEYFPFGTGLGFFSITYDTYSQLQKPYLLELEFYNIITKLGLFGAVFFFIVHRLIIKLSVLFLHNSIELRAIFFYIFTLLVNSLSQTALSSVIFPFILALCVAAVNSQKAFSKY